MWSTVRTLGVRSLPAENHETEMSTTPVCHRAEMKKTTGSHLVLSLCQLSKYNGQILTGSVGDFVDCSERLATAQRVPR